MGYIRRGKHTSQLCCSPWKEAELWSAASDFPGESTASPKGFTSWAMWVLGRMFSGWVCGGRGDVSTSRSKEGGRERNMITSLHRAKGEKALKQRFWNILTVKICGGEGPSPAGSSAGECLPQQWPTEVKCPMEISVLSFPPSCVPFWGMSWFHLVMLKWLPELGSVEVHCWGGEVSTASYLNQWSCLFQSIVNSESAKWRQWSRGV